MVEEVEKDPLMVAMTVEVSSEVGKVWTIYKDIPHHPGLFVVVPFTVIKGEPKGRAHPELGSFATLEEARDALPKGLMLCPTNENEDPTIVESWWRIERVDVKSALMDAIMSTVMEERASRR